MQFDKEPADAMRRKERPGATLLKKKERRVGKQKGEKGREGAHDTERKKAL